MTRVVLRWTVHDGLVSSSSCCPHGCAAVASISALLGSRVQLARRVAIVAVVLASVGMTSYDMAAHKTRWCTAD